MSGHKYKDGVIIKAKNDTFICIICVGYLNKRTGQIGSLQKHLETEKHVYSLKKYNENFSDDIDGLIMCKKCNNKLNTYAFFNHAKTHKLKPWFYEMSTHFAADFVLYNNQYFYCYVCKKKFNWLREVKEHNRSHTHKAILKKKFPKLSYNLYNLYNTPMTFYQNNNVFIVNEKYCWCWICDVNVLTSEVTQHSKKHNSTVDQQKSESILSCKSDQEVKTIDSGHANVYDDDKQSSQVSGKVKHLTKYTGPLLPFTCGLCDIRFLTLEQAHIHCNGPSHNDQLEKFENKLNTLKDLDDLDLPIGIKLHYLVVDDDDDDDETVVFECTLCKLKMFTITKVLKHIDCIEHFKNMTKIYTEYPYSRDIKLPDGILSTTIDDIFYCHSCHVTLRGFNKISCHIQDKEHCKFIMKDSSEGPRINKKQHISKEHLKIAESTNEYPSEIKFISAKNDICKRSFWWCLVCSCALLKPIDSDMSSNMKVWTHIVGINHIRNKKKFNKSNCDVKKEQDKSVDEIVISLPLDDLYDVQIKNNQRSSATCKPCKFHIYGDIHDIIPDWNHHLFTKNHQQKELGHTKNKYKLSK